MRPRTRPGLYRESAFQAFVEANAEDVGMSRDSLPLIAFEALFGALSHLLGGEVGDMRSYRP
jgi:hypothetical protein